MPDVHPGDTYLPISELELAAFVCMPTWLLGKVWRASWGKCDQTRLTRLRSNLLFTLLC